MTTLKTNSEFQQVYKKGYKRYTKSLIIFFIKDKELKIGYVVSKKVGNAVIRNKIKRRLRAILNDKALNLTIGRYIFVAKPDIVNISFDGVKKDIKYVLKKIDENFN